MEVTGLQIGFDAVVALISGIVGALTVWHSLKGKVAIQQLLLKNIINEMEEFKNNKKENHILLHTRIDNLKEQVDKNREKNDGSILELKTEMGAMELRIIQAIHELK
jgi:hypothetical protein